MTLALSPNPELFRVYAETAHNRLLPYIRVQLSKQRTMHFATSRDPTTALLRRSVFFERLEAWQRHNKKPMSMCLVELEDTEQLYQKHDVAVVNQLIAVIGSVITASFGIADLRGRYQATIFSVAFPGMTVSQCSDEVEALLAEIAALRFYDERGGAFSVTCCAGMSQSPDDASELGALCKSAERKLWRAARQGTSQLFL